MSEIHSFSAVIEQGDGGGAFVTVPFDIEEIYGKKRIKVKATFDGVEYRGSIARMGSECFLLIILKEIRSQIGKGAGDEVLVTIQEDAEPRIVIPPDDFIAAMQAHPGVSEFFYSLSYTNQREYAGWITDAKQEQTRRSRIEKGVKMLAEGIKRP